MQQKLLKAQGISLAKRCEFVFLYRQEHFIRRLGKGQKSKDNFRCLFGFCGFSCICNYTFLSVCGHVSAGADGDQKRGAVNPLELELQVVRPQTLGTVH